MQRAIAPALLVLGFALPLEAQTAEETVTLVSGNGQPFVGTLALPEGAPAPVVLLLHGFTGSRDELKTDFVQDGIFTHTAKRLADAGFASLRIDFRGSGESLADLDFAETTFEGQIADALAAIDWLAASEKVKGDDIYLIGWSQGGGVAAAAAGRSGALDAVALWAAVADVPATFGAIFGPEAMKLGEAAGAGEPVAVPLPWGGEITLNGSFFDAIATYDPRAEIAAYAGPLFVAQGTLDDTVPPENADMLLAAHEGEEEKWTAEMDHVFNSFTETATLDAMIGATMAFFEAHDD
ncbi:alpha/beta fold hydrolase [Sulfitobacter sp. LCG007]